MSKNDTDCHFFITTGCTKGSDCIFRHSEAAKNNATNCRYWMQGSCTNHDCVFRHPTITAPFRPGNLGGAGNQGRTSVPCRFLSLPGGCRNGASCPFSHEGASGDGEGTDGGDLDAALDQSLDSVERLQRGQSHEVRMNERQAQQRAALQQQQKIKQKTHVEKKAREEKKQQEPKVTFGVKLFTVGTEGGKGAKNTPKGVKAGAKDASPKVQFVAKADSGATKKAAGAEKQQGGAKERGKGKAKQMLQEALSNAGVAKKGRVVPVGRPAAGKVSPSLAPAKDPAMPKAGEKQGRTVTVKGSVADKTGKGGAAQGKKTVTTAEQKKVEQKKTAVKTAAKTAVKTPAKPAVKPPVKQATTAVQKKPAKADSKPSFGVRSFSDLVSAVPPPKTAVSSPTLAPTKAAPAKSAQAAPPQIAPITPPIKPVKAPIKPVKAPIKPVQAPAATTGSDKPPTKRAPVAKPAPAKSQGSSTTAQGSENKSKGLAATLPSKPSGLKLSATPALKIKSPAVTVPPTQSSETPSAPAPGSAKKSSLLGHSALKKMSGIGTKRALGSANGPSLSAPPKPKAKRKEDANGGPPNAAAAAAVVATAPVMAAQKQIPLTASLSEIGETDDFDAELMDMDLGDLDDIDVEGVEFDEAELDAMLAE